MSIERSKHDHGFCWRKICLFSLIAVYNHGFCRLVNERKPLLEDDIVCYCLEVNNFMHEDLSSMVTLYLLQGLYLFVNQSQLIL
jgi:hypothetical protein